MKTTTIAPSFGALDMFAHLPFGPKLVFAPENEGGTGGTGDNNAGGDDAAAKATAEKAAADKVAADKAAADKAAQENKGGEGETEAQKLLREVMEKKQKIKESTDKITELQTQLSKFDGIDPDAVRALLAKQKADEVAAEEAKGNFDRVKQMMAEENKKLLDEKDKTIADLQALLGTKDGTINELTVGRSFSDSKYITDELTLTPRKTRQLYGAHFENGENGVVAYDKPKGAADRTMLVDATGTPLSFDAAIKRLVESDPDKDHLIKVKMVPGGGSATTKVNPTGGKDGKTPGLFGRDRIAAALANEKK